ncbi:MAG: c-type cytochrome [Dokdonella sp.]|uniref:c-type cytochrome n=1 Tax=Dokdonella sp. TaxID=2291710 RepID=UPI002CA8BADD|nr:c-type cytochrome [Dokdonella sp.]HNV08497.1 c-type cytochrome [Dokdonella sp.]HPW03401.1 c-type cytochrome [Dokdonella sp.]
MTNPVPQTDAVFLKHFAQLITFLVVVCILLILLGAYIYSRHPSPENPAQAKLVDQRLAPVGAVYAGATGQAAIEAAAAAAKAAAASAVAYGGTLDGKVIFDSLCNACHVSGAGGSPTMSDKANWAPRVAQGLDTLVKHATEGFTGKSGMMPAKGGNPALSDEQVHATVEWMISQVK